MRVTNVLRNALAVAARMAPAPIKRFCRERGLRPGKAALRLFDSEYEPDVQLFIRNTVRTGDTCIDVGANDGVHTALMARLVGPTGRVVAYEAHPDTARDLRAYVAKHPWGAWVRVEHAAVTDGATTVISLYPGPTEGSAEWNIVGRDIHGHATEAALVVPAVALDAAFPEDERVDFVKIDAEGAGGAILQGMRRIIESQHPAMFVEVHDNAEVAAVQALEQHGYKIHRTDGAPLEVVTGAAFVQHAVACPGERSPSSPA
jgi:FkbM family methyltransferase